MKHYIKFIISSLSICFLFSCRNSSNPNYQYFPNMYESLAYEAYVTDEIFKNSDGQEAQLPVEGTVPRGWKPYNFKNSNEDYLKAKKTNFSPIPFTEEGLKEGQELYNIYCAICHGKKGNGKGTLVKREKILGVPSYDDKGRNITIGSVYHVMYYGLNSMGSYAAQTSIDERWKIAQYVMKLKSDLEGKSFSLDEQNKILSNKSKLSKVSSAQQQEANKNLEHVIDDLEHEEDSDQESIVDQVIDKAVMKIKKVIKKKHKKKH